MNITIRHEQPSDFRLIEEITRDAFWNLYCPGCNEHFIIHNMRNHNDFIDKLSFVVELDGLLVGSIFYTRSKVISSEGEEYKTITFGPVSIAQKYQRKGLGKALISHSIEEAKKQGYIGIIIGGFPYHYSPYGFEGAKKYGISLPDGKFYTGIMALPLYHGALEQVKGKVYFSEVFEVDADDAAHFDLTFSQKEKCVLECQNEFARAVVEIDKREW